MRCCWRQCPDRCRRCLVVDIVNDRWNGFFAFLQMEPLIQHFALSVLDMLVLTLFPELKAMIKAG